MMEHDLKAMCSDDKSRALLVTLKISTITICLALYNLHRHFTYVN